MFEYFPESDVRMLYENWKKYTQILRKLDIYIYDIKNLDDFTKKILKDYNIKINENVDGGVFIYVPEKVKVRIPIEACYVVKNYTQKIQNVTILAKDSQLVLYKGCFGFARGKHIANSNTFIEKNAEIISVMLHKWEKNSELFAGNYVYLNGGKIRSYFIEFDTEGTINFNTIYSGNGIVDSRSILIARDGETKIKNIVYLKEGKANLISKVVTTNANVKIISKIEGEKAKGYTKCDGIILGKGTIESVPALVSKSMDSELYHEAKIGKVSKEVLEYFMSRGLSEEEGIELYIKGFITSIIPELDERLKFVILSQISRARII